MSNTVLAKLTTGTLAVLMALLNANVLRAATPLEDLQLDKVRGGSTVNQNVAETTSATSRDTQNLQRYNRYPRTTDPDYIVVDSSPSFVAVMQADNNIKVDTNLSLTDEVQQNTAALNVVNSVASDTINTNNIMLTGKFNVAAYLNQGNISTQSHRDQGMLNSSDMKVRHETKSYINHGSESFENLHTSINNQRNFSESRSHSQMQWDVGVDKVPHGPLLKFVDNVLGVLGGDIDFENINTGFVFAGQGRIAMLDEASVKINGQVTVDVNIPFTGIKIFDIKVPFKVLDITIAPFEFNDIDGAIKAVLFDGGLQNEGMFDDDDELSYSRTEYSFQDNSLQHQVFSEEFHTSSFSETLEHNTFVGGQMENARANIIGMSDSNLTYSSSSDIEIGSTAQQGLHAINVVNAAATISANSFNISQSQKSIFNQPVGFSLKQNNLFKQNL